MSDSEDDGQPKVVKRLKITDSDHEGEENDDLNLSGELQVAVEPGTENADETLNNSQTKLVDSDDDEMIEGRLVFFDNLSFTLTYFFLNVFLNIFSGGGSNEFTSDFDQMLAKKRDEKTKRRKRRDIDIINDNDDLIAQLLQNMKQASEVGNLFLNQNQLILNKLNFRRIAT